jgi:type II secretory pathway pseudopilin PulG
MFKRFTARVWKSADGFSLVDTLATVALVGTMAAVAVPALTNSIDGQRLGIETRNVEREIQLARLTAVSTNRPIRVRFNCPETGSYRRVELIGTVNSPVTGDDAESRGVQRCNPLLYPFPAADKDPLTRPNNDGPVQRLNSKVAFTSTQTLEFWPNGTVHIPWTNGNTGAWAQIDPAAPVNLILTKGSTTRSIVVNTFGKIQFQ